MRNQRGDKLIRRYSEGLKRHIVEEIESDKMTAREASKVYGIGASRTVHRWVHKYGKLNYATRVIRIGMKSEAERIRDLEEALADEKLARRVMQAQLESYEHYVPDLKKRLSTKELEKFEKNEEKMKTLR